MHTVLHVSMIEFIRALAVLSRIATTIRKHGANTYKSSKHTHQSASSPLQVAPARSSSSITYIFMSKDCFIHDADVFAFHCAIRRLQNNPKTTFPRLQHHQSTTGHPPCTHPLLTQRCQVSHLSLATECRLASNLTYSSL